MKTLTKKLLFTVFAAFLALSCLYFASVAFNKQVAEADAAALEAEFTDNGKFEIKTATTYNNTYSFINGTTVGGTGAVLQVNQSAGTNLFKLDLTSMKITKADIVSIVVRLKAANFTLGSDEFRTIKGSDWVKYGTNVDLSNWYEYTLNATSKNQFTINNDGTIGYLDIGIRSYTSSLIMYVDSITISVTERDISAMEMQNFDGVFNSASFNSLTRALLTYSGTATWDASDHGNLQYKVTLKNSSTDATALYSTLGYAQTDIHWARQKWINLALPGTYDTIIIAEGAHFAGVKIPAMTLVFNNGWQFSEKYDDLNFVGIHSSYNNDSNGYFIFKFDTNAWTANQAPTNMTGFRYNGNALSDLTASVLFYKTSSLWLMYTPQASNSKLAANYNGYSHPTIEIEEGASFEYGGHTYTFHAITFYLNLSTNKWQTEVPDGYYDHPEEATFTGVWGSANEYNSSTQLLLQYSATTWDYTDKGDLASYITYRNSSTSATFSPTDSNLAGWNNDNKGIILSGLTGYDVIEIAAGGTFGGVIIPAGTFYLVNGHWTTGAPHAANTNFTEFASDWNNRSGSGLSQTILNYSVKPLGAASDATNLAATLSRTSLMVKYNGSTFFDLYSDTTDANHEQYKISYAHSSNHFYFSIPTAALTDGATLVVEDGTPFMNYYLGGVTLVYNASLSQWEIPVNYNPSLVAINSTFNNDDNGFLVVQFDTTGWAQGATPTSYMGITYNGNNITDLTSDIKFYQNHSVWFNYTVQASNPKLAANYNGYSHPTIAFAESATMVYGGETYTFHAITFYLNLSTKKWQTEVPDGYTVRSVVSYSSVNASYNNNQTAASGYSCTLIQFSGTIGSYTGTNLASTLGANITVSGSALSSISGAVVQIGYNGECTDSLWIKVPLSALVEDGTSGVAELVISDCVLDNFILSGIHLYLVDGAWSTTPPVGTPDCYFTGFSLWNNNGASGATILQFRSFVNIPEARESYLSTTGNYIKLNGVSLVSVSGTDVYSWENQCWLCIEVPNPAENDVLTIEEGTPFADNFLPKLAFKFVGGIWHKAFTVNIDINSDITNVYSVDDVPVMIDDTYFEKLLAEKEIPAKLLSFSIRGVKYKAGTTFKVLTDTDITVQTIGFNTVNGAYVRLNNPTGIRFETLIDKADYDALVANFGNVNVETGTYIVPSSFLTSTDFRSYFADSTKRNGTDYVKIVNYGFYNKETAESDGYYQFYGSLVNINPNNYCTDFFGIGYIKITDGGTEYIVYGGYNVEDHTRNIYYVSGRSYKDFKNGTEEKTALKGYLDGVVYITDDAKISTITAIDGYSTPYSITYNSSTGVYTITGDTEIKSVMIDGKKKVDSRTSTLELSGDTKYIIDYNLTASALSSTLTFKLSDIENPLSLVDFTIEVPSDRGVKILQLTDTEIIDATQMRTSGALTQAQQEEYARKNIYANCLNYITELIANDRPDLIIITGDIVNGNFDDNGSIWLKLIEFMDSLDIPWAPVFGTIENTSAKGAAWQRAQLLSAENCLFKAGTVTGNGDYTIGITDGGVIKRVIYMLDSATNDGISSAQVNWVKTVAANLEEFYGTIPAFICYNKDGVTDFSSDFATAHIDGVFKGNLPNNNSSTLSGGIYYTYGTKTGSYGTHNASKVGGTYIAVSANGQNFTITAQCFNKDNMKNKESIHLVETYDGSSVVTDAYLAPIWDTDRIYDETGIFVGETGSVTLMYTPTDPYEVVVRDITLGVIYTYGIDYTISGNRITRVAGGNLPYMSYDEYYRTTPIYVNDKPQGFTVTPVDGKAEDGYPIVGTKYLYFSEGFGGFEHYVTFTYDKTEAWTGTNITGDANAQDFISKLKTDKEAKIMFYGDSITVGCNASGTVYGGFRNPNLPAWNDLVTDYLESLYGADITKYNGAVGGWTTAQGAENLSSKLTELGTSLDEIDLFVIAFGMNDPVTSTSDYIESIEAMIDAYYAANPTGSVLLVSSMRPNTQSALVSGNQYLWESALNTIKNKAKYSGNNISVAKVFTVFDELRTVSGKLTRDYLGNNINHPNDFGVRIYAQVILKTLCGDDFG